MLMYATLKGSWMQNWLPACGASICTHYDIYAKRAQIGYKAKASNKSNSQIMPVQKASTPFQDVANQCRAL
jgi:hypothetical protein